MKITRFKFFGEGLLLCCTLIWGFAFIVVKDSLDSVGVNMLNGLRFSVAGVTLGVICIRRLVKDRGASLLSGLLIGFFLWAAYTVQTYGINYTTPGKNAFLTTIYVVFVPLYQSIIKKEKPKLKHIITALTALVGIGILCLNPTEIFKFNLGDALSALCGVIFAAEIVSVDFFSKKCDVFSMTCYSFLFTGLFSFTTAAAVGESVPKITTAIIFPVLFLSLAATVAALLLQNIGQKYCAAPTASIIMGLESVFGTLFSVLFGMEKITLNFFIGAFIIFASLVICEIDFTGIKKSKEALQKPRVTVIIRTTV